MNKIYNYCPLCLKNGIQKKIKAFQINMEEATWSCEDPQCIWPIGYEKLEFFPRDPYTCDWENPYSVAESIPIQNLESAFDTPPDTPRGESFDRSATPAIEDKLGEMTFKNESLSSRRELEASSNPLSLKPSESDDPNEENRNMREQDDLNATLNTLESEINIDALEFLIQNRNCTLEEMANDDLAKFLQEICIYCSQH